MEGNTATLTCGIASGNPAPNIQWFRNDVPTVTTSEYEFEVSRNDDGIKYRCEADNGLNKLSQESTLEVECMAS